MQEAAAGMLALGDPYYRLPERELDADIQAILSRAPRFRYNAKLGRTSPWSPSNRKGTTRSSWASAPRGHPHRRQGDSLPGVMSGLDFLARLARAEKPDLGERVLVIGGGNTAMDAPGAPLAWG
jgi:NADPH-dependent glutamate synthase beta subunit-like oxidoreductase